MVFEEARRAAWISIWTLVGIGVGEVLVSAYTGSLTLFADGLDSMADALVSFIVWFGIRMLQKPKSRLFHFGYAKIESLAAFISAVVILILASFIVYNAYQRILNPVPVQNVEIVMIALAAAGGVSLHRAFKVRKVAKKYNLVSLNLDAKNSIKDGTASFVGLGSIIAAYFGIPYMDSVGSILIAVYIFFMSATAFKESTLVLIDGVKNPELQQEIAKHIEKKFNVRVEKILLRPLGHDFSAQVHVELDKNMTLDKAHETLTSIRNSLIEDFKAEDPVVIPKPV
ncbi:MAG TPA: cation diffusion facilitator family transporter [Nitrososphaera sp.]|jgi:cation diffusion facilitator family transporter|nr:cation diffusion facilitator family transporter [Nitrososphaera sp.]